jgi:hypothetical protein
MLKNNETTFFIATQDKLNSVGPANNEHLVMFFFIIYLFWK